MQTVDKPVIENNDDVIIKVVRAYVFVGPDLWAMGMKKAEHS